ncbi:hypothetical protein MUP01_14260 [Candidatus Bathyarchaeota archaeon]|nr:hypothetical protein [Candidatus Bathyarchaeota archaeon]
MPTESPFFAGIRFKSHNSCVRAGLNPLDWMRMMKGHGIVLHKIVLSRQQAEHCVVAEGCFIPTFEELSEFGKRRHMQPVGILRCYQDESYEKSFVPLLEYSGGYNLPEVLIPFSVKAEAVPYAKVCILVWKLKMWFTHKTKMVLVNPHRFSL